MGFAAMRAGFKQWLGSDLALDLGTACTQVGIPGEGLVLREPTVVAVPHGTSRLLGRGAAVGHLARQPFACATSSTDSKTTVSHRHPAGLKPVSFYTTVSIVSQ